MNGIQYIYNCRVKLINLIEIALLLFWIWETETEQALETVLEDLHTYINKVLKEKCSIEWQWYS